MTTLLNVLDEKAFFNTHFVVTMIGDLLLQLVQPGEGKTIYREFLEKNGEGVFHIGFEVADISIAEEQLTGNGMKILARGRRDDESGFSCYNTRQDAGVTLLVRQTKKISLDRE